MSKFRTRIAFIISSIFLWLAVLVIALEIFGVVRVWWIEKHNELIQDAKGGLPKPIPDKARAVVNADQVAPACSCQAGWATFKAGPALPDWAGPASNESKEESEKRRRLFPVLSQEDRTLFAIINNDLVITLDATAHVQHSYGNWVLRRALERGIAVPYVKEFRKQLLGASKTVPADLPAYVTVSMPPAPEAQNVKEVFVLKGTDSEPFFAFIPSDLKTLRFLKFPENTPWDGPFPYFRYKKNLRNTYSGLGIMFDTNNFGFRDDDVVLPKPANVLRLACIGGSTTEEGPSNATTYPNILEKMLNAQFPGGKYIDVINCGTSGLTTTAHIARLADYLQLDPDMLVVYEGVNDIHRDLAEMWRSTEAPFFRRVLSHSWILSWAANPMLFPGDEHMRRDIRGLCIENLRVIGHVARCRGIRMAVCSVASPEPGALSKSDHEYFDYHARTAGEDRCLTLAMYRHILALYNEEVRALCEREGFLYIPVAEHINGGADTFTDIYHMTDTGIERKAEIVFDCLKEYLAPAL